MDYIANFEKVSYAEFEHSMKDINGDYPDYWIKAVYDSIKLPKRATVGSAGYDFFAPYDLVIEPGETLLVPTGVRAKIVRNWVLMLFPRSGLGFKYRMQLNNTVGIIDSDYYHSDNEGHIFAKFTNDTNENKTINIDGGNGMMQGIFVKFGITEDDETCGIRNGGFGSTT